MCIIDHNWWQMRMSDKWHLTSSICKSSASHQVFLWWLVSLFFVEGWVIRQVVTSRDVWKTTSWQCFDSFLPLLWLAGVLVLSKKSHRSEEVTKGKRRDKSNLRRRISRDGRSISILALLGFQAAGGSRIQSLLDLAQKHRESVNPHESAKDKTTEKERNTKSIQKCNIKTMSRHVFFKYL